MSDSTINLPDILRPTNAPEPPQDTATPPPPAEISPADADKLKQLAEPPAAIYQPDESDGARQLKLYTNWQNSYGKARIIKQEIMTGITKGDNIYPLFLKALQAIAELTDDQQLHDQAGKIVPAVYGDILQEPALLRDELDEIERRIEWARKALARPIIKAGKVSHIRRTMKTLQERRRELLKVLGLPDDEPVEEELHPINAHGERVHEILHGPDEGETVEKIRDAIKAIVWKIQNAIPNTTPYAALAETMDELIPLTQKKGRAELRKNSKALQRRYLPPTKLHAAKLEKAIAIARLDYFNELHDKLQAFAESNGYTDDSTIQGDIDALYGWIRSYREWIPDLAATEVVQANPVDLNAGDPDEITRQLAERQEKADKARQDHRAEYTPPRHMEKLRTILEADEDND